ncbi:MAG: hypothetical protein K0Q81_904, partial [Paenibacillus sp.]|nr:hypothetical protein [Paenibacillus sp.]
MYSIYLKYKDREILYLIPLVLLSLAVRLRYYFKMLFSEKGFPDSADAQWYLDYAHGLLEDFRIGLHLNDILYMGYNFLLALLLAVFRNTDIILFIQTFTAAVSVILVYQI